MMYLAYGRVLESDQALPELDAASAVRADIRLVWDATVHAPAGLRWTTLWRFSSGEPWVTTARAPNAHHFRFGGLAEFRVSASLIEMAPRGRVTGATLRHLLLDQALPLALASRGALVVHASAVSVEGRAVLFAGRAGAGKSTLAALLAREGATILADDGVLLEESAGGLRAVPSYPGLRLFSDSSAAAALTLAGPERGDDFTKRRVVDATKPEMFQSAAAPLGRIYVLSEGPALSIDRVSRRDAAMEIVRHAYRADVEDPLVLRRQLDAIAGFSASLDVWILTRPRDFSKAREVARAVAAHAVLR